MVTIIHFQNDLRVLDNPNILEAIKIGEPIVPVYIYDDSGNWARGSASKLWLHHALKDLDESLRKLGSKLIVSKGDTEEVVEELKLITKAQHVLSSPYKNTLLFDPEKIRNKQGGVFKVFTPYYKHLLATIDEYLVQANSRELYSEDKLAELNTKIDLSSIKSLTIEDLNLLGSKAKWNKAWQEKMLKHFQVSEAAALEHCKNFANENAEDYLVSRDRPDQEGTSKLAPYLHFGQISPFRIWQEAKGHEPYLRQLVWREFAYYVLYHFPDSANNNLRKEFDKFPWKINTVILSERSEREDPGDRKLLEDWIATPSARARNDNDIDEALRVWQLGMTGYPIVDAGMRELWETGWMHNRVRMVVGSFLVKDLLIHWKHGAEWFWETLFDADLANNSMGWQWVAGSGVDASPFFRIFNPITQGEKFDPNGDYVRKWIPELAKLPNDWIHKPWEAPPLVLAAAGIELGKHYPEPIVNHDFARKQALEALRKTKVN